MKIISFTLIGDWVGNIATDRWLRGIGASYSYFFMFLFGAGRQGPDVKSVSFVQSKSIIFIAFLVFLVLRNIVLSLKYKQ